MPFSGIFERLETRATIEEFFDSKGYFANAVSVFDRIETDHWTAIHLTINSGTQYPQRVSAPPLKNDLLTAHLAGTVLTVKYDGQDFYSADIAEALGSSVLNAHMKAEAIMGYGPRQVIILMSELGYDGELPRFLVPADLNPQEEKPCGKSSGRSYANEKPMICQRPLGHKGIHQEIDVARATFADFSAGGSRRSHGWEYGLPTPCSMCGFVNAGDGNSSCGILCQTCDYWMEQKNLQQPQAFVIEGEHYRPGAGGFGGHVFKVLKEGGSIWTGQLWHQGLIPDHMRHLFPDNASFIKDEPISIRGIEFG
jgi:hypothetical protein